MYVYVKYVSVSVMEIIKKNLKKNQKKTKNTHTVYHYSKTI